MDSGWTAQDWCSRMKIKRGRLLYAFHGSNSPEKWLNPIDLLGNWIHSHSHSYSHSHAKREWNADQLKGYIIAGPILYVDGTSLPQLDPCPLRYSYHLLPTLPLSLSRSSDIPPFNIIPTSTDHILLFHNSIHMR